MLSRSPLARSPPTSDPPFGEFVALVALMMGLTAFAVDAVLPAFPVLGAAFRVADPNRLQLVVYVYMLAFGVAQLVYGPASDIVGRRPAYLAGLAIFAVGTGMALLAPDLPSLLAARFVQGLGAASGRVLATAIVRDRFSGRSMARVMSINMSVFITVPIFAPAIGSGLIAFGGWHALFIAMAGSAVAIGLWFGVRMPETLAPANRLPASLGRVLDGLRVTVATRATMGYATAVTLLFGCIMSFVGSAQQVFAESFGLGAWFPAAFAGLAVSMGLAAVVNASVVERFGMHRMAHASMVVLVALGAAEVAVALAWQGRPPLPWLGPLLALSQFFLGLTFPNLNALALEPLGRIAGTASSMLGFYSTVGGALCGLLVGGFYDGTVLPLALGYGVLPILALAVVAATERGRLFASARR